MKFNTIPAKELLGDSYTSITYTSKFTKTDIQCAATISPSLMHFSYLIDFLKPLLIINQTLSTILHYYCTTPFS